MLTCRMYFAWWKVLIQNAVVKMEMKFVFADAYYNLVIYIHSDVLIIIWRSIAAIKKYAPQLQYFSFDVQNYW